VCGSGLIDWRLSDQDVLQRCTFCRHVQRDLMACPAGARDLAYGGEPAMDRVRTALTFRRLRRTLPQPPRSVFEVGYGSGALLRRFLDAGATVAGADPGALHVPVDDVVARQPDVMSTAFASAPALDAELVYAVHVVEHVDDVGDFFSAAAARLAPGGVLVIVTPAGDSRSLARFGSSWWMLEDPTHVRFFSARSLTLAARAAGLQGVRVSRPVMDSLSVEAASIARRRSGGGARGALTRRSTRLVAVASLPVVLPVRLLAPRWRPVLQLVARRPSEP
jgi:SAM-dependent methyltransferase